MSLVGVRDIIGTTRENSSIYMKIYDEYYDREKNIASMNRKVKYE